MEHAKVNRGMDLTNRAIADGSSLTPSSTLHASLVATCEGKALVLVERAGRGEGIEAWRRLVGKYEPQTKQSRVVKMVQLLFWNFKGGDAVMDHEV